MLFEQSHKDLAKLKSSLSPLSEPEARPALIVISGLPGAGKTYFARRLREQVPAAMIESDAMRKALFPSPSYDPEESRRVFHATHLLIEDLLQSGISVIFDATNLSEVHREPLYRFAAKHNARLVVVRVHAPPEVVRERLRRRFETPATNENSDADWDIYLKMLKDWESIKRHHFAVDTSRDITPVMDKIVREIRRGG